MSSSTSSSTVKIINERQAFETNYKSSDSPEDAVYRKLWDVSFYDQSAQVVWIISGGLVKAIISF
jgi:hypothetical protein